MGNSARLIAVKALLRVSSGGYSNIVLDKTFKGQSLSAQDKAFASTLFYGTLERRITLDHIIKCHSKTPINKLSPEVLETLRMGLYQMLYMNSVADFAAVNESVELIKALGNKKAGGFINGILRSFLRSDKKIDMSMLKDDEKFSVEYSVPLWLCRKWLREYGKAFTKNVLSLCLDAPPMFIRVNTLKVTSEELLSLLSNEGVPAFMVEGFPNALRVQCPGIQYTEAFKNGLFHVQDLSSQLAVAALGVTPGARVFDPCAAPGGKSFSMALLMENKGEIISGDLHENRVKLIESGAERLGINIVKAVKNDASVTNQAFGEFDYVICDAPCSGLGVLRRKPEIRFKNPKDLEGLPEIQFNIAKASAKSLKKGGIMLYSTCTLSKAENEEVVERLIKEEGLLLEPLPEEVKPFSDNEYMATLEPQKHGGDGFFFARLRKGGD